MDYGEDFFYARSVSHHRGLMKAVISAPPTDFTCIALYAVNSIIALLFMWMESIHLMEQHLTHGPVVCY